MNNGIQFDSEGGFRYTGANGEVRHVPAEPVATRHWTFSEVAKLQEYHGYGKDVPITATVQQVIDMFSQKREPSLLDYGNLVRIASASEKCLAQAIESRKSLEKIAKLCARLERVLKLFEIVLKPVADDVLERKR